MNRTLFHRFLLLVERKKGVVNQQLESFLKKTYLAVSLVTRPRGQCTNHPQFYVMTYFINKGPL